MVQSGTRYGTVRCTFEEYMVQCGTVWYGWVWYGTVMCTFVW